ncbi:MAG: LacI family DNA-binding transcriptional regulator [Bacteroidota bacterium]
MSNPGKEITIYDIAEKLGISAATVSRGLKDHPGINKNTKKKILEAAAKMGYRSNSMASNLRKKRSNIIGVIVPRLNSSFMSDVIAGMEKVVNDADYTLIISQSLETMKKEISNAKAMYHNRVDGLLVSLAYDTENIDHFEPFISRDIPLIFFDRVFDDIKCPSIVIDNFKAAYEATSHLIAQGCKRIVHIGGNPLRNVYAQRLGGYKQALADNAIKFDKDLIITNNLSAQDGLDAANFILSTLKGVDGVFAANDVSAIACMQGLKKQGIRVPQDVAFAGFNNDPSACVIEPNLTTINYKGFEMGEVAANLLINHLVNNQDLQLTHTMVLRHELIIRQSSLKKTPGIL